MGKKGSWLSVIKRVFIPNSKEKVLDVQATQKKVLKEKKKWGFGKHRHGDTNSFIPLYSSREPSSIEKILGEAEKEWQKTSPLPFDAPQRKADSSFIEKANPSAIVPAIVSPNFHHVSAIKIQTAYRGYQARRSFRALKGLVRLQGLVRGQSVKHQTTNAMRCMQVLVRVQTQIQSRRIQMIENKALQRQNLPKGDKEQDGTFGRWTVAQQSENGQQEEWDDSLLSKEELEARMQRKAEAIVKREKALAYAYAHQQWKTAPKSTTATVTEIRSGGFPWWWNWLERQLPAQTSRTRATPSKDEKLLKPKATAEPSLQSDIHAQAKLGFEAVDVATPKSFRPSPAPKSTLPATPSSVKTAPKYGSSPFKPAKPRAKRSLGTPIRDDDSLTSCPPFSVPNYMAPTVSAKAKARAQRSAAAAAAAAPSRDSKRRFSFPFTQSSFGALKWNKGTLFSNKDSSSTRVMTMDDRNLSMDSTLSLPVGVGMKAL